jgi:hypothetical protein
MQTTVSEHDLRRRVVTHLRHSGVGAVGFGTGLGGRATAIYTIVETAKLNRIDPEAYLCDTLERIAEGHLIRRIDKLLPWSFNQEQRD